MNREQHYTGVFQHALWGEPRSGVYARPEYAAKIVGALPGIAYKYTISSVYDAPCGDFTWMQKVAWPAGFKYVGADIVKPLIDRLQAEHPELSFKHRDLVNTKFPSLDLWLCRDFLYMLKPDEVAEVFANFLNAHMRFAIFTCHRETVVGDGGPNADSTANLMRSPFNFPEPLERIDDWHHDPNRPGLHERFSGLWSTAQLRQSMRAFMEKFG